MVVDKVFYTDGHDVMVTDSNLTVKKKQYRLIGITDHALKRIKPLRLGGLAIVLLGILVAASSTIHSFAAKMSDVNLFGKVYDGPQVLIAMGIVIAMVGLIWIFAVRPRYAVHISTAEGDTDVVVSTQREYVRQIVNALNRAVMALKK